MWQTVKQWDRDLFVYLNSLGVERYDRFWIAITQTETWIPLYLLFGLLIFYYYRRRNAPRVLLLLLLSLGTAVTLSNIVKHFVARLRPSNVPEWAELIRILQTPSNFSFFSGHAATSFAATTFAVLALRKFTSWVYLFFIWPILFSMSRIYVGVHYPSDILVGTVVGIACALIFYKTGMKKISSQELREN